MTTILYLLLLLGGEPWRGGLDAVPVRFEAEAPYQGALGLACDPVFRDTPGNVQERCHGFEGVILYSGNLHDRDTMLNALRHEDYHLTRGPKAAPDPFDEAGAYRAGCAYQPHDFCPAWLADHPEVRP